MKKLRPAGRNILSLEASRAILAPHENTLRGIVRQAWGVWSAEISVNYDHPDPRTRANVVHNLITDGLRREFGDAVIEHNGRFLVTFGERLQLFAKKFGRRGRPQNYPTAGAQHFATQPLFDMPFARVVLGYELDGLGEDIRDVLIKCFHGQEMLWSYSLEQVATVEQIPLFENKAEPASGRVRAKKRVQKELDEAKRKEDTGTQE